MNDYEAFDEPIVMSDDSEEGNVCSGVQNMNLGGGRAWGSESTGDKNPGNRGGGRGRGGRGRGVGRGSRSGLGGDEDRGRTGEWECSCGENNFASRRNCFRCNDPKPGGDDGDDEWSCECGASNIASRRSCFKCKGPKPGCGDGEHLDEKPKPYVPAPELEGDQAFDDRKQYYEGSGINFSKYNDIKFDVTGVDKVKSYSTFADMKLSDLIMQNIAKVGYTTPTPIQRHASAQFMAGLDVMACAQTGSGKTAAFLLPIINQLLNNQGELSMGKNPVKPEALILAPTRELVIQINREARLYSQDSVLRCVVCYGGTAIFAQKGQLQAGCNIMVATPGRLLQFVNEGTVSLTNVQYFVLDEADRMLDMGFMGDVKRLVDTMPPVEDRLSGMFSATFQTGVQKAAAEFLKSNYVFISIGIVGGACSDVVQEFLQVERSEKRGKLLEILRDSPSSEKVLVFCNNKKGADFLASSLSAQDISTTSIHGDRLQSERELALRDFTQGKNKVLVATAVAARGLDIPKVSIVVNYDLPNDIDEYVQRIGRTGRLGHTGRAISFYEESQDNTLAASLVSILKGAGQNVPEFFSEDVGGYGLSDGYADIRNTNDRGVPKPVEKSEDDWE
ncbi:ATP-dependent RNA helicase vasa isoform X2 [Folsomia candida]|uniref:ATP-dependent RNA helicase vasa isoform X2 n=1 Tax=Folsomia candida TaxID=158441 RepID=UPI0016052387|nr:ATP-dependent RNA helicase vasa isoform X2 [Folsomia candida]XP_035703138.1 ATP-dependent RNA helicase vasa isoform X2 [Folsomia candida]